MYLRRHSFQEKQKLRIGHPQVIFQVFWSLPRPFLQQSSRHPTHPTSLAVPPMAEPNGGGDDVSTASRPGVPILRSRLLQLSRHPPSSSPSSSRTAPSETSVAAVFIPFCQRNHRYQRINFDLPLRSPALPKRGDPFRTRSVIFTRTDSVFPLFRSICTRVVSQQQSLNTPFVLNSRRLRRLACCRADRPQTSQAPFWAEFQSH